MHKIIRSKLKMEDNLPPRWQSGQHPTRNRRNEITLGSSLFCKRDDRLAVTAEK